MTTSGPPDHLDVPIERLPAGRGQTRRAAIVAGAIVVVVGGAFGMARLSELSRSAAASAIALAPSTAPGRGVPSGPPSPVPSARAQRIERLPDLPSIALPGAPEVTLIAFSLDAPNDLQLLVWTPDDGRTRTIRTIPGVLTGEEIAMPVLAPDRRHLVLVTVGGGAGSPGAGAGHLVDDRGRELWAADRITTSSGVLWSADSRMVVVAGQPRRWHLVSLGKQGAASDRVVRLPSDVFLPHPIPSTWMSSPELEPRTMPIGFSADGNWIYGGVISSQLGLLVGEFRVSVDGERIESVTDFRVGDRDGLEPRPGTTGTRTVDPASGRIATSRVDTDAAGGPQTVEVRDADEGFLFAVDAAATLGAEWGGDGALYALTADSPLFADELTLERFGPDGAAEPPLFQSGPLTSGALAGVRDGYAVVAFLATRPTTSAELIAIRLSDPSQATALPMSATGIDGVFGVSLDR